MGLPQVNIVFKQLGASAIQRGERGIVALLLKDTAGLGTYEIFSPTDIPSGISDANKKQIELAMIGYINAPLKIIARVGNETDWNTALAWLETQKFDYLSIPEIAAEDLPTVTSWVSAQRANGKMVKAVLPNCSADREYIVNFTTDNIISGGTTYTTAQYCARIAGLLAGTPLNISATFAPLPEVTSVQSYTKTQLDTAIDNGEFVIFHDGEKVKVARAVNSLKTITADKGESFKKCKIVDILDQVYMDVKRTIEDNYIGKYPNSYDNKILLMSAIKAYFDALEIDNILDEDQNRIGIDIDAQRNYLNSIGVDTTKMNEQQIKEANTRDKLFFRADIKPLDAMEEISIVMYL
jgi:Phage tail sheath protein subtilisin-like domain/Phage tail sheath C-terminal domain